ncbi:unnamed protein product [Camellia sinensis]
MVSNQPQLTNPNHNTTEIRSMPKPTDKNTTNQPKNKTKQRLKEISKKQTIFPSAGASRQQTTHTNKNQTISEARRSASGHPLDQHNNSNQCPEHLC